MLTRRGKIRLRAYRRFLPQFIIFLLLALIPPLFLWSWKDYQLRSRGDAAWHHADSTQARFLVLSVEESSESELLFPTFADALRHAEEEGLSVLPSISMINAALEEEENRILAAVEKIDPATARAIMTPHLRLEPSREIAEMIRSGGIDLRPRPISTLPDYRLYAMGALIQNYFEYAYGPLVFDQKYQNLQTQHFHRMMPLQNAAPAEDPVHDPETLLVWPFFHLYYAIRDRTESDVTRVADERTALTFETSPGIIHRVPVRYEFLLRRLDRSNLLDVYVSEGETVRERLEKLLAVSRGLRWIAMNETPHSIASREVDDFIATDKTGLEAAAREWLAELTSHPAMQQDARAVHPLPGGTGNVMLGIRLERIRAEQRLTRHTISPEPARYYLPVETWREVPAGVTTVELLAAADSSRSLARVEKLLVATAPEQFPDPWPLWLAALPAVVLFGANWLLVFRARRDQARRRRMRRRQSTLNWCLLWSFALVTPALILVGALGDGNVLLDLGDGLGDMVESLPVEPVWLIAYSVIAVVILAILSLTGIGWRFRRWWKRLAIILACEMTVILLGTAPLVMMALPKFGITGIDLDDKVEGLPRWWTPIVRTRAMRSDDPRVRSAAVMFPLSEEEMLPWREQQAFADLWMKEPWPLASVAFFKIMYSDYAKPITPVERDAFLNRFGWPTDSMWRIAGKDEGIGWPRDIWLFAAQRTLYRNESFGRISASSYLHTLMLLLRNEPTVNPIYWRELSNGQVIPNESAWELGGSHYWGNEEPIPFPDDECQLQLMQRTILSGETDARQKKAAMEAVSMLPYELRVEFYRWLEALLRGYGPALIEDPALRGRLLPAAGDYLLDYWNRNLFRQEDRNAILGMMEFMETGQPQTEDGVWEAQMALIEILFLTQPEDPEAQRFLKEWQERAIQYLNGQAPMSWGFM